MTLEINYITLKHDKTLLVPLELVKNYLKIIHHDEDLILEQFANAAIDFAEKFTGICLRQQEIRAEIKHAPEILGLKYRYLQKIFAVKSNDSKGEATDISASYGACNFDGNNITFKPEYIGQNITIDYLVGYGAAFLPEMLRQGILMHIAAMYEDKTHIDANVMSKIKAFYNSYRLIKV
jgi:uncharacterized phiE125 gp8 family phage protein